MSEMESIKEEFLKAWYTEDESTVLAESAVQYKTTIGEITTEQAIEYLKQAYDTLKL